MSHITSKESYSNLIGKRKAQIISRIPFNNSITHVVALGGKDAVECINNHRDSLITHSTLVEWDVDSYKLLKKQSNGMKGVKVRNGNLLHHLPRKNKTLLVEADFESTIKNPVNQSIISHINRRGYNWALTVCLRGCPLYSTIETLLTTLGEVRIGRGPVTLLRTIPYRNHLGGNGNIKISSFSSNKRVYQIVTYKSSQYNTLMCIITPMEKHSILINNN